MSRRAVTMLLSLGLLGRKVLFVFVCGPATVEPGSVDT